MTPFFYLKASFPSLKVKSASTSLSNVLEFVFQPLLRGICALCHNLLSEMPIQHTLSNKRENVELT